MQRLSNPARLNQTSRKEFLSNKHLNNKHSDLLPSLNDATPESCGNLESQDVFSYRQLHLSDGHEAAIDGLFNRKPLPENGSHFTTTNTTIRPDQSAASEFGLCGNNSQLAAHQNQYFRSTDLSSYPRNSTVFDDKSPLRCIDISLAEQLVTQQGILEFQSKLNSMKNEIHYKEIKQEKTDDCHKLQNVCSRVHVCPTDHADHLTSSFSSENSDSFSKGNQSAERIQNDTSLNRDISMDVSQFSSNSSCTASKVGQNSQGAGQVGKMSPDTCGLEMSVESFYDESVEKDNEETLQAAINQKLSKKFKSSQSNAGSSLEDIISQSVVVVSTSVQSSGSDTSQSNVDESSKVGQNSQGAGQVGKMSPDTCGLEMSVESFYDESVEKDNEETLQAAINQKLSKKFKSSQSDAGSSPEEIISQSEVVVSTSVQSSGSDTSQSNVDESSTQKMGPLDKHHVCLKCCKLFRNKPQLSQHELVHSNVRKHVCSYCDKTFKQLCHLNQHIRTHTGDRPYKCVVEGCGRSFGQLSNLKHHQLNHDEHIKRDESRLHRCDICERGYANESSLWAHILKLHSHVSPEPGLPHKRQNQKSVTISLFDNDYDVSVTKVKTESSIGPRSRRFIGVDVPLPPSNTRPGTSAEQTSSNIVQSNLVHSTQTSTTHPSLESQCQPNPHPTPPYNPAPSQQRSTVEESDNGLQKGSYLPSSTTVTSFGSGGSHDITTAVADTSLNTGSYIQTDVIPDNTPYC